MAAVRRGAWVGLKYVTTLFFVGVIVQFFLVGYGLFAMKHGATIDDAKSLDPHRAFGFILSDLGAILLLILALLAWPRPRAMLFRWILLAVLAFVQSILATVGFNHWGVGMFHPVNALLLFALSGYLTHYAWRRSSQKEEAPTPATVPSG